MVGIKESQSSNPISREGKRRSRLARAVNPFLNRFRMAFIYKNHRWSFATKVLKPNRRRQAHSTGVVNWSLSSERALPMSDDLARSLINSTDEKTATSRKKVKAKARRYISPKVGVVETFKRLNEAGVNYAVLRWFDELPNIKPGEDIDMLVADDAVQILDDYFLKKRVRGAIPCDIYSESGLRGTAFRGLPYYEKRLATELLDNVIMHNDLVKVPSPKYHFLSLAYHALYHKADASGLPFAEAKPNIEIHDHDYAAVLAELGRNSEIPVEATLLGLRETLERFDWNPSVDTIRKLALKKPILKRLLPKDGEDKALTDADVSTLIIRQWAYERNLFPWILANIRHFGFDIKLIKILSPSERDNARLNIRGGNWNQGPYPVSGGEPAAIVAVCDYAPEPIDKETLLKQPFAKNERLLDLKRVLRNGINSYLPKGLEVNAIHSADDGIETLHYLKAIDPDLPAQFIASCHKGFEGDPFTKLVLHEGKRATTYIVFRDGKPGILKVFSECEDGSLSLLNEKRASQEFSGQTWFPEIYATGTNWILQEYFDQSCRLDSQAKTMETEEKLDIAGKVVSVISQLHEMGFAHRDIHGGNFFVVDGVIKLIDYETLIEEDKNIPIENCYDISGKGLESPFLTAWMCYSNTKERLSLNKLLDVSFADAYRNMQTKQ